MKLKRNVKDFTFRIDIRNLLFEVQDQVVVLLVYQSEGKFIKSDNTKISFLMNDLHIISSIEDFIIIIVTFGLLKNIFSYNQGSSSSKSYEETRRIANKMMRLTTDLNKNKTQENTWMLSQVF